MLLLGASLAKNDVLSHLEAWWKRRRYIFSIIAISAVGIDLGGLIHLIDSGQMPVESIGEGVALGIIAIVLSVFVAVMSPFVIRKARRSFSADDVEPDV